MIWSFSISTIHHGTKGNKFKNLINRIYEGNHRKKEESLFTVPDF
jgi:hypothetical protein